MEYDLGVSQVRRVLAALESRWPEGFDDCALMSFTHRVQRVMDYLGIRAAEQLEERILCAPESSYAELVSLLLPRTTELFRDPDFWKALRHEVLVPLRERGGDGLCVWVAGFDSGEELYSLCLLLASEGLLDGSSIVASHLVPHDWLREGLVLPSRRQKIDIANAESVLGESLRVKYCASADGECVLPGSLVSSVHFAKQSIRFVAWEDRLFHLVLCRNHLLYYGLSCSNANLELMASQLVAGGVLAVGIGEDLVNYQNGSKFTVLNERESLYRKLRL